MKYILIAFLICFISCKGTSNDTKHKSRYTKLLSKFETIAFDTLEVNSIGEGSETDYKYNGKQLDSLDAILFPTDIAKAHFNDPPGLFACYKFQIDSTREALIARTPSEYSPTSIKLFIYRADKDTLEEISEIALYIGDAGALRDVTSWIFKDKQRHFQVFTWTHDTEDNSVENEHDTTISVSNSFALRDLSNNKLTEMNTSISKLPAYLKRLVDKKASR
jgi:hypothetical protein